MKISLKPLKGENFDVECEDAWTVADLKKKIGEMKPEFPVEQQKLIYAGKVLADATPVNECGIKDGTFVVVMAAKVKPPDSAPAPAAAAPAAPAPVVAAGIGAAPGAGGGAGGALAQLRN